jgi:hypothetical protein
LKILSLIVKNLLVDGTITHNNYERHSATIALILNWEIFVMLRKEETDGGGKGCCAASHICIRAAAVNDPHPASPKYVSENLNNYV